jgi:hypothetical protein
MPWRATQPTTTHHLVFEYGVYLRPGLGVFLEHVARVFRVALWTLILPRLCPASLRLDLSGPHAARFSMGTRGCGLSRDDIAVL